MKNIKTKGGLHVAATLRLVDETGGKAFGPGVAQLLEGVRRTGSLRGTAGAMGMSYSKAWKVLHESEARLGILLLERQTGGAGGGGSRLTPEGDEMIKQYAAFREEGQRLLAGLAARYFGEEESDGGTDSVL